MDRSRGAGPIGTQTLMRGLSILEAVADARDGVTVQEAAQLIGIHRTMAMRSLEALAEFNLVRRGGDGRFRIASGVLALAQDYQPELRNAARPILERLAETSEMSACLFIVDGDAAVAFLVTEPTNTTFHLTFRTGSRHPLDRGSVAYALAMLHDPAVGEHPDIALARRNGYARSHSQVESGAWGVSAPVRLGAIGIEACILAVSSQEVLADRAPTLVVAAAQELGDVLTAPSVR